MLWSCNGPALCSWIQSSRSSQNSESGAEIVRNVLQQGDYCITHLYIYNGFDNYPVKALSLFINLRTVKRMRRFF